MQLSFNLAEYESAGGICCESNAGALRLMQIVFLFALLGDGLLLFCMVFFIILFSDLECDFINPIDLCNKLNQFVLPEHLMHGAIWAVFLLTGNWWALLINTPLAAYHLNK